MCRFSCLHTEKAFLVWTKNKTTWIAHRKARKEMFSYLFDFCCLWNGFFPAHVTVKQQCAVGINTCFTWHLATTRKLARRKKRGRCSFYKAVLRLRGEVIYFSFSRKVAFHITLSFIFPLKLLRSFFQSRQPELRSLRTINRSSTLSSWPSVLLSSLTCTFYVWKASNLPKGLGHLCRCWD